MIRSRESGRSSTAPAGVVAVASTETWVALATANGQAHERVGDERRRKAKAGTRRCPDFAFAGRVLSGPWGRCGRGELEFLALARSAARRLGDSAAWWPVGSLAQWQTPGKWGCVGTRDRTTKPSRTGDAQAELRRIPQFLSQEVSVTKVIQKKTKPRPGGCDIFRRIWVRHNTGWYVTTRVAWLASVGDRAICPRPLLRAIPSVPRACIVDLKLASASASAYRRSRGGVEHAFDLGGWASCHFTEVLTRRPASTELEPAEPDRAPDRIGAYGRRTLNTNHVPFASFRIEWTSGVSAPECGVAGGGDGCHAGRPASIWDLSSAGRSYNGREWCIPPLSSLRRRVWRHAPWPLGHVHSASRRPPHEHHTAWHEKKAHKRDATRETWPW